MAEKKSKLEAAEAKYQKLYAEYQALREDVIAARKARDEAIEAEQAEALKAGAGDANVEIETIVAKAEEGK
jgi:uncharacterized protein YdcH (DUF465 family)